MKKVIFIAITIVVIIYCVFFVIQGKKKWRYAAAQSNIQTISYGAKAYIKEHLKPPSKIEDLVTSNILTQEQLDFCLVQDQPVKILSTNDGEYLIKYQHPVKPENFFGVKMNGESASDFILRK